MYSNDKFVEFFVLQIRLLQTLKQKLLKLEKNTMLEFNSFQKYTQTITVLCFI